MFGSNQGYKIIITYFFHSLFIIGGNPPTFSDLWKFKMILDKSSLKNISCKFDNCQYILIFLILDLGFVDWKNSWSKQTPCSLMDVWAISLYVELFSCAQLLYFSSVTMISNFVPRCTITMVTVLQMLHV